MTDSTPVGRITSMLESAGYQRIPSPLVVGGLKFDFAAALIPASSSSDLILVADTAYEDESRLIRKVEGVARALDISRSTRSLTLVITGPRPATSTLETLGRVCRVLPTGTVVSADAEATLQNWLAILLPLEVPQTEALAANPLGRIQAATQQLAEPVRSLIDIAPQGGAAVQKALYQAIDEAAKPAEGDQK